MFEWYGPFIDELQKLAANDGTLMLRALNKQTRWLSPRVTPIADAMRNPATRDAMRETVRQQRDTLQKSVRGVAPIDIGSKHFAKAREALGMPADSGNYVAAKMEISRGRALEKAKQRRPELFARHEAAQVAAARKPEWERQWAKKRQASGSPTMPRGVDQRQYMDAHYAGDPEAPRRLLRIPRGQSGLSNGQ